MPIRRPPTPAVAPLIAKVRTWRGTSVEPASAGPRPAASGKVVVITGASSGIGRAAALELARQGATVAVVGRDPARTSEVAASAGPGAQAFVADFTVLAGVRRLAQELLVAFPRIDVLVNNAGFIAKSREVTVDGIETTFAVNHVAAFVLTEALRPALVASGAARVITTSSDAHRRHRWDLDDLELRQHWTPWTAYGNSKMANILFTEELARRGASAGITAHSFHPGVVHTGFGRDRRWLALGMRAFGRFVFLTPEAGADTLVWLAGSDEALASGGYYVSRARVSPRAPAGDAEQARGLWEITERLAAS